MDLVKINIGQTGGDKQGDTLRDAFRKVDQNMDVIEAALTGVPSAGDLADVAAQIPAIATVPATIEGVIDNEAVSPKGVKALVEDYDSQFFGGTRSERWHGADSFIRTRPTKFGDTVDLADFFDTSGSDASGASNAAQLTKLIAYLNANPNKTTLVGRKQNIVRLDTSVASNFPFPSTGKFRARFDGALFDVSALQGTYSGAYLEFPYADVDGLNMRLRSGTTFRRLIQFTSTEEMPCISRDIMVAAETQINNMGSSPLLDYALRFYGSGHRSRSVKSKQIDWAFLLIGDVDTSPTKGHRIEDWSAESFCNGFTVRNVSDTIIKTPSTKVRSVNGISDPGHNSFLGSALKDFTMIGASLCDAAEHGSRVGGSRNAEQESQNLTFTGTHVARPGQTSMKFFTGTVGQRIRNLNVVGANIIDCQYEPALPLELPGFNDEGILAQQIEGGVFSGITVDKRDSITGFSCDCAFFGSGLANVVVNGLRANAPRRNVIRLDQYDDGQGVAPVETLDLTGFRAVGVYGSAVREDGIYFNFPTKNIRDVDIDAKLVGLGVEACFAANGSGAAARYLQPVVLRLNARNFLSGLSGLPAAGNNNLRVIDAFERPQAVGTAVYDAASIAAGAYGTSTTVTAAGAVVGDTVVVSGPGEALGIVWIGQVSAANTVRVVPINTTTGAVDPASGTIRVRVFPA